MVEPRKPQHKLQAAPNVTEAELAEFERLLSERFETDPSKPEAERRQGEEARERRLKELSAKIKGI
jgi:hypothetical protein